MCWMSILRQADKFVSPSTQNHSHTWPFAVWGLHMMGPFKTARGRLAHLLVAVDNYTKWVEAEPIKKLDGVTARIFFIDIIHREYYLFVFVSNKRNSRLVVI